MIKEFRYDFDELQLTPGDLYELLGFEDGGVPDPFPEYIERALSEAPGLCSLHGGYRIFDDIAIDTVEQTIRVSDQVFSPAKIVTTQLKKSTATALFACTAGAKISEHAHIVSTESDPMLGYVFDVTGSIAVEKTMDMIQDTLKQQANEEGLSISDRFSPGYCDWNVAEQQKLFSLLPEDFCGITLSGSSLMHPIKSVSGIIGIGPQMEQKGYQCKWCTDKNCYYGKIRRKK